MEVAEAFLPSTTFCFPERAACTRLIDGAVALDKELPARPDGKVVNYVRFAKRAQFAIVASLRKKTFEVGHRSDKL